LSREVLGYMVFGLLIIWLFFIIRKNQSQGGLVKVTALVGLIALFFSSMAYSPPSFPALNNGLPFVFFLLTAFILGSAVGAYFAPEDKQSLLTRILATSLIVGLVIYLLVPCIWWSGGTVMRLTAQAYVFSPLYWIRVLAGLGLPLLVLWKMRRIPFWLPIWLLAGEILGRIMFFTHVPHTVTNIGGLF
jgi:DMSO reductase anchor subunit